jgi:hypothetical protein
VSPRSEAPPPPPPARETSRGLDVLTAILLGVVSLTTALGAWQAGTWSARADDFGASSSDARDVSITRAVDWQQDDRLNAGNLLQARRYALLEDEAIASGDFVAEAYSNVMTNNYIARMSTGLDPAFQQWRADGFPADESPINDPVYLAELRGGADAYALVSVLAGDFKGALQAKADVFAQAALIDALALFLLGVAGINRLRAARFATLALGGVVYLASLVLMVTAY